MVTLAALCLAQGLDMHATGETGLARIWMKVEAIRAKQAAKPKYSPLPAAAPQPIIGRLMDQISALPVLWGLNEPGALPRNSEVFRVLVAAGRERAGIAAALAPQPAAEDTCAEMRALCSACGGAGDVHRLDGKWRGQCTCVHAWQQRAEKAEARVKEVEASSRQALQAEGGHPAPCARDFEAPSFANQVRDRDARSAQLEAQLVSRRSPLSPEMQQAMAAARAAGQTIAATPGGLAFMNDGVEPDYGKLDCPACDGSGHAADVAGSTS